MLTAKEKSSRPGMTGVLKPYYMDLVMLWNLTRLRNLRNVWKQMTDAELIVPVGVKSPGQMTWTMDDLRGGGISASEKEPGALEGRHLSTPADWIIPRSCSSATGSDNAGY